MDILTCYFNPCKYKSRLENYLKFREKINRPLITVELSFDGDFDIPDAIHISGSDNNIMWQKERLLNIALHHSNSENFAYIDCDVFFDDDNWYDRAIEKLKDYHVVRLFDSTTYMNNKMEVHNVIKDIPPHVKMNGIAWAYRRDILSCGLYDKCIAGQGDSLIYCALGDEWSNLAFSHLLTKTMPVKLLEDFLKWSAYTCRNNIKVCSIENNCFHYFHGHPNNRKYYEVSKMLSDHNFDPNRDIFINDDGIYEWSNRDINDKMIKYFYDRKEDETIS